MMDEEINLEAEMENIRSGGGAPEPAGTTDTTAPSATDDEEGATGATAPTPTPPADPQPTTQQDDGKEWNEDGPGKPRVALKHAREALGIAKADAERARQEAAQFRAQLEAIENAKRQAEQHQALQLDLENLDPEDVPAYLDALRQQDAQRVHSEYQQRLAVERASHSVELMRETFSDFDQQIAKLHADPSVNWAYFDQQPNPAKAAYDYAKTRLTPDEIQARIEAEKQAWLAEIAPRTTTQPPRAPRGLSSIPAAATAATTPRDPVYDVTQDEIAKMSPTERREWMEKSLAPRQ